MTVELGALSPIVARKHVEVEALRCAAAAMWATAERAAPARPFIDSLHAGTVIAEMKRRSPSGGALRPDLDPVEVGGAYERAGAAALSVLTDGPDFGGSLDDLAAVRGAVGIPVLRKDFVVDPLQIAQARVAGADAVLLIVAVLGAELLDECLAAAERAGMDALVEVHDIAEAECAVAAGARCVGVNNRDLRTLHSDLATFAPVRAALPPGVLCVAESGVREVQDVRRMRREGADAVLVGEALMRANDPAMACAAFVAAAQEGVA